MQAVVGDGNCINDVLVWKGSMSVLATASGEVAILKGGQKAASFTSHAGGVSALSLHPSGDILASVGLQDKTIVFYDLAQQKELTRIITDSRKSICLANVSCLLTGSKL